MTNKPEPLNGKIYINAYECEEDMIIANKENIKQHIECIGENPLLICKLEDIKSACEFYLRYKDKPYLLMKEQGIELDLSRKDDIEYVVRTIEGNYESYSEWLFKYIFWSVMKDE